MDKSKSKTFNLKRRQRRVRAKVSGTPDRPRLRVTRSNAHIYAQVIDDVSGRTLCSCSSLDKEFIESGKSGSNVEGAKVVGQLVGKRAGELGITEVVYDRGGRIYHGRVQALAEGARESGLKF